MTANTTAAVDAPRGCDEVAFLFEGGAGVVEAGVEHGHPVVRADAVPRDVDATVSTHRKLRAADARKLRADYEKRYEAQFGLRIADVPVEFLAWTVGVSTRPPAAPPPTSQPSTTAVSPPRPKPSPPSKPP